MCFIEMLFSETESYTTVTNLQFTSFGLHSSHHQNYVLSRTIQYNQFFLLGLRSHSLTAYVIDYDVPHECKPKLVT
jgi:hypothetical protein